MSAQAWNERATQWAIQTSGLVKRYGSKTVLSGLDLNVPRGGVHGLLGPNGSGKTTTLRILIGLVRASSGSAQILGHAVPQLLPEVIGRVGAIIESPKFSPRVSARRNLNVLAESIGAPSRRVTEVLLEVGLASEASNYFGTFSLGMKQRLAIAATLLKSPEVLIFDEPTNGLDPVGIHEIRATMRRLADAGRTVLVSSHILTEIEQIADSLSIIAQGKTVAEGAMEEFLRAGETQVLVGLDQVVEAADVLRRAGWRVERTESGLSVFSRNEVPIRAEEVAKTLGEQCIWPRELSTQRHSLEQVFLALTSQTSTYVGSPKPQGGKR